MRTAFVTGATGLLGNNLVRELADRGWAVRALVRDEARARRLLAGIPKLTLVAGTIEDAARFAPALAGVDAIFHTAAYFRESYRGGSHWPALQAVNVDGTRTLIALALTTGVRRFLHVSSIGTLAVHRRDGRPVDETLPEDAAATGNDYFRSKILADAVVTEALRAHPELFAAFVLPGFMNGPGDAGPTAAGQMIADFAARRLPGIVDAHLSFVDARDVARACVEAEARAERGARYVVAGRRLHLRDAYTLLARVTGVPAPTRRIPFPLLGVVAAGNEAWARLSGRPVLIGLATYRNLRATGPYNLYDSTKAERELGVTFRPLETTFRDAALWMRAQGLLPEARSPESTRRSTAPGSVARSSAAP